MIPTLEQLEDWHKQLCTLAWQMEITYGAPGDNNQQPLDAAVHVALYVARAEFQKAQQAEREGSPA